MKPTVDLTGFKSGMLTVIKFSGYRKSGKSNNAWWLCECDCGNEKEVSADKLKRLWTKSCGCITKLKNEDRKKVTVNTDQKMETDPIITDNGLPLFVEDIHGKVFGRLTVKEYIGLKSLGESSKKRSVWMCECSCGTFSEVTSHDLKRDNFTQSCGCVKTENMKSFRKNQSQEKDDANWYKNRRFLSDLDVKHLEIVPTGSKTAQQIYDSYKKSSLKRGYSFNLSIDNFTKMIQSDCYYCGTGPSNIRNKQYKNGGYRFNGVDRIDNNENGYSLNNCAPCCGMCNYAKSTFDVEDFRNWIHRAYCHTFEQETQTPGLDIHSIALAA